MEDKLIFRPLKEEDYETICKWWKWWRWPIIPKEVLPDNGKSGFMVEKNNVPIVSGFLYLTNSNVILLEWIVSNPNYKDKDRKEAIKLLINNVEKLCINMEAKWVFSIGRSKHLIKIHEELGWTVDKKPSYEIIKNI
tara:strand:+ start:148 stop:558 length:411 start_codon:yes stop_codon:yes gene_type:complete